LNATRRDLGTRGSAIAPDAQNCDSADVSGATSRAIAYERKRASPRVMRVTRGVIDDEFEQCGIDLA